MAPVPREGSVAEWPLPTRSNHSTQTKLSDPAPCRVPGHLSRVACAVWKFCAFFAGNRTSLLRAAEPRTHALARGSGPAGRAWDTILAQYSSGAPRGRSAPGASFHLLWLPDVSLAKIRGI
jgi:hypothetical protein